ncbi:MAG: hypothetical protein ABR520_12205, partial [Mycobacteriales bacterium]|nr:hypothetical protein [Frankia sp.]
MRAELGAAVRRRLSPAERYGLRLTLLVVALVLVAVPFGLLVEQVLNSGRLVRADTALADALHRRTCTSPTIVDVAQGVSIIGSPPVLYV